MTAVDVETSVQNWDAILPDCEGKGHQGRVTPAHWIDIRICGCQILKCHRCADILRADLPKECDVRCAYCRDRFVGRLHEFIRLEAL